jgi:hypothetical protein
MGPNTAPRNDYDDLSAPDIVADVRRQFKDAAYDLAASVPTDEPSAEIVREGEGKDGNGAASFSGAPKPSPHDELGQVVYARDPDERTDPALMGALGIGAALTREQDAQRDLSEIQPTQPNYANLREAPTPSETPRDLAESEPHRPNYESLKQEHAAALAPVSNEYDDLTASDIRAGVAKGYDGTSPEATQHDDLTAPDIRAGVVQENAEQRRTQTPGLGL